MIDPNLNRLRLRGPQDVLAGAVVIVIATVVLLSLSRITTAGYSAFSPALFPRLCAYGVAIGGVILVARGVLREGPQLQPLPFRPVLLVTLAVIAFGVATPLWGYAPGGLLTLAISGLAAPDMRARELVLVSATLIAISVALFSGLLKLTIPILILPGLGL